MSFRKEFSKNKYNTKRYKITQNANEISFRLTTSLTEEAASNCAIKAFEVAFKLDLNLSFKSETGQNFNKRGKIFYV